MKKLIISFLTILLFCSWKSDNIPNWIIQKPINLSEKRLELLKEYNRLHTGINSNHMNPKIIVIHWTAMWGLWNNWSYFNKTYMSPKVSNVRKYGWSNVAIHFLVDRNGKVYQLMPTNMVGRHIIGLNHCSIGIENIGQWKLTYKQLLSNVKLVRYLKEKHKGIEYVIGHHEQGVLQGTDLWIENFDDYRSVKVDPGVKFMNQLRYLLERGD